MFKRLINILLTILLVNCNYNIPKGDLPLAKEGIIDLRNIDFSNSPDQVVDLDGSWVFIWNEFVNPNETEILSKYSHYINVPSQWQKEKDSEGKTYPAQGYASYYLKVLLPENYPELSISMSDTGMAYSLYLNGELQSSNGKVGKSKEEMEIRQKYAIFPIRDRTLRELNIIIHNSNFHYHKAGLWQRIRLGKTHVIEESHYHNIYIDLIVASCLFIMGLYHLG
ncbi:MAG: hypothetical protein KDK36_12075, partial [Leptospiraceae bacterium]|nr:hypothetical protein [Leptospiraceae bacterium]